MKKTNYFYQMLIALGLCGLMYCGDGGTSKNAQGYDSSTNENQQNYDSMSSAHQRDPSTAYPQPPVTGSNEDSTHTKDTINRPKH
ncbi:hypothetical protein [Niastella sp. OAS944]|uniref:hypothetical protein n=1 Tax=Niastella sp. OAS944 TaxID=2664089 RepID=UPI00346F75FE|nr:hypothetical protein [Chitinophagaceae bacterium OAS944]